MPDDGAQPHDDTTPVIPDVRDLPLDVVLRSDDSALGNAVRQLVGEMAGRGENYAAHSSST